MRCALRTQGCKREQDRQDSTLMMYASQRGRHKLNTYLNNGIVIDYDLNHEISKPGYVTESK